MIRVADKRPKKKNKLSKCTSTIVPRFRSFKHLNTEIKDGGQSPTEPTCPSRNDIVHTLGSDTVLRHL